MVTPPKTALQIATAALEQVIVDGTHPRACRFGATNCAEYCVIRQAREALAAMRAAPGLADDESLVDFLLYNPAGDNDPRQDVRVVLGLIDAYQREKVGLK